jgi:hypothetical protein
MSVILGVIGLLFVAYGGWMGFRLAKLASLAEGPDMLVMYFGMPGGIVLFGLLLLAAAEALRLLRRIGEKLDRLAAHP